MTAAVLYGKEDLRLERVAVPQAGPGELVVRVGAALTCGTDLKVYRRGYHAMMLKPPIPFGHELAGVGGGGGRGVTTFRGGRPGGGAELGSLRCLFFLQARAAESVRGPSVQQRSVCGVHSDSGADCGEEYAAGAGWSAV